MTSKNSNYHSLETTILPYYNVDFCTLSLSNSKLSPTYDT